MGKLASNVSKNSSRKARKARTPEARENQMIAYAENLAEKQLIEGTASSQVIVHYLKLGSIKAKKELERLEKENQLLEEKVKTMQAERDSEAGYKKVLEAFRTYSGAYDDEEDFYDEPY